MGTNEPPFTCVTCESVIGHRPTFHVGLAFCCAGCVADGPCICSYDQEAPDDAPRAHHAVSDDELARADDLGRLVGAAR